MRRLIMGLFLLGLAYATGAQNTANYMEQGGSAWYVGGTLTVSSGGTLTIASGGSMVLAGTGTYTGGVTFGSTVSQTLVNAAGGSANPWDYTGTLGIMNGSDDFTLFDVNITNANHTGVSNTIQGIDIANITGDADATETAIKVGTGWDDGINCGSQATLASLVCTAGATFGGGYGSTGATISTAGVGQFNGAVTTDGLLTASGGATVTGGTVSMSADAAVATVNIGTGGAAKTVTVGSSNSASALTLQSGTGDISVSTTDDINVYAAGSVSVVALDGTTYTGNVTATKTLGITPAVDIGLVQGHPKIGMVALGTMVNGTTNTLKTDIDDDTPAGEWTAIDADTTTANTTSYNRAGTNSLDVAILATATAGDGITNTLASGDQDWTSDESFGFWAFSTTGLDAGDLVMRIADATAGGGYTDVNVPACAQLSWTWVEVDVSGVADNLKDAITDLSFVLSAAGAAKAAAGAFHYYADYMVKWDGADEEALGYNLVPEGVIGVWTVATAAGSANTQAIATNYTDYFINYQTGNDVLVAVTDQSANSGMAVVSYQ